VRVPPLQRRHNQLALKRVRPTLLLASNSPRRRALLVEAGFEFEACSPRIKERFDADLTLRELTMLNAIRKGMAAARAHPKQVVLAADTLVAIDNKILGKPRDVDEAIAMLKQLSGRIHDVCTSVFFCHLAGARSTSFSEISRVRFRRLTRGAIDHYLARIDPLDKAGAYAAQGFGTEIIENINGSFTNVIGLPMEKAVSVLAEFEIQPKSGVD
jgi:septum formation protein